MVWLYNDGYMILADEMEVRDVEYLKSEFFAEVTVKAGHTFIYIPYDFPDDDKYLFLSLLY